MTRITIDDIPDMALCPNCGKPMKVTDIQGRPVEPLLFSPGNQDVGIECCGYELSIESSLVSNNLKNILIEFHKQHNDLN